MGNMEIVQGHYAAAARGDLEGMLAPLSPEISWTEAEGSLYAGTYRGPEAVVQNVFAPIGEQWENFAVDIDRMIADGGYVVAIGHYSGTHRHTGRPFRTRMVHIWRLEGGLAVEFEQILDNEPMNRAAATP
jgi:ketosteroid isomerase-like protein